MKEKKDHIKKQKRSDKSIIVYAAIGIGVWYIFKKLGIFSKTQSGYSNSRSGNGLVYTGKRTWSTDAQKVDPESRGQMFFDADNLGDGKARLYNDGNGESSGNPLRDPTETGTATQRIYNSGTSSDGAEVHLDGRSGSDGGTATRR